MAVSLAEPTVLAAAKDTPYPNIDASPDQYTITEAQFTQSRWGEWTLPDTIRHRLAPYNTLRLVVGEPDRLGVGMPATTVLKGNTATTSVTLIEAKGRNNDPAAANMYRSITQPDAHLPKFNLEYVAAPTQASPTRHARKQETPTSTSLPSTTYKRHALSNSLASLVPVSYKPRSMWCDSKPRRIDSPTAAS